MAGRYSYVVAVMRTPRMFKPACRLICQQSYHQLLFIQPRMLKQTCSATTETSGGHMVKQAEVGFSSGGDRYDTYRPGYTDESVELIAKEIISQSNTVAPGQVEYQVLELGAGTGKLTESLSKKLPSHLKYMATEPSQNFLDVLKGKGLNVDAAISTADNIPLGAGTVGNVVCAQCFHWFADKKDVESIRRVMIPGAKLILVWNVKRFEQDWMKHFYDQRKEVVDRVGGSLKYLVNSMEWQREINVSPLFKLESYKSLAGVDVHGDIEAILANFNTVSAYNSLPPEEREMYAEQSRQALKNWPGLDLNNITMPYSTEFYVYVAQ